MEPVDSAEKALRRAALMLSRRTYSKQELFDKLLQKGCSVSDAENAVLRLCELNVLDDVSYALRIREDYFARGYGLYRVRQELKKRKIARETIDELLSETPDPDEKIRDLILQKLRGYPPDLRTRKRISDFLIRRGYSYDEIAPAMRRLFPEDDFYDEPNGMK